MAANFVARPGLESAVSAVLAVKAQMHVWAPHGRRIFLSNAGSTSDTCKSVFFQVTKTLAMADRVEDATKLPQEKEQPDGRALSRLLTSRAPVDFSSPASLFESMAPFF